MKYIPFFLLLLVLLIGCQNPQATTNQEKVNDSNQTFAQNERAVVFKPTVSFTFDDGRTSDQSGFKFHDWNQKLLSHLDDANLKAVFFVTGENKLGRKGKQLLNSWNDRGHQIANHTFNHPNFSKDLNNAQVFENELLRTDSLISSISNHVKLFRFPYLKEGKTGPKADSIRQVLKQHGYSNGYVTIDASDWYVDQRLKTKIKEVGIDKTDLEAFKAYYLDHLIGKANYYEKLSFEINGRHISHTLLLHHNLAASMFLGDLIERFKQEGWNVVDAPKAFQDEIFQDVPSPEFAGKSLIYSLAKQSGQYDHLLRFPAEDSQYEKAKMDSLGL